MLHIYFSGARASCLLMSAFMTLMLLRASGGWASAIVELPSVLWTIIIAGFLPAFWLVILNIRTYQLKLRAESLRDRMEEELIANETRLAGRRS